MVTRNGKLANRQVFNFAVFDGHGGEECSQFLCDNLAKYVEDCDIHSTDKIAELYKQNVGGYWKRWRGGFEKYIASMSSQGELSMSFFFGFLTVILKTIYNSEYPRHF